MSVQFATIPLAHNYPDLPGLVRRIEAWGFEMVGRAGRALAVAGLLCDFDPMRAAQSAACVWGRL